TGGERFVIVLASTRFDAGPAPVDYSVSLADGGRAGPSRIVDDCSLRSEPWQGVALSAEPAPEGEGPVLATTRALHVTVAGATSQIDGEVVSVGAHATVIRDTTHPATLDGPFAEQFRADFEDVIMPRARQVFGTEP